MRASGDDGADLLRSAGGLLLAVGALAAEDRMSSRHELTSLGRFALLFVPMAILYAIALDRGRRPGPAGPRPWQSVLAVLALALGPFVLVEFLDLVGASPGHALYLAAVFALSALLAAYTAWRLRVAYAALIAGLSALIAWLEVWGQILGASSADTIRWLLIAGAALLLVTAAGLARAKAVGARELVTAGGIAGVSAGVLGVLIGIFNGIASGFSTLGEISSSSSSSSSSSLSSSSSGHIHLLKAHSLSSSSSGHIHLLKAHSLSAHTGGLQGFGWNLYLLALSLALVWIGARAHARGPVYVGAVGLLAFVLSVGAQVVQFGNVANATGGFVGWPLALVLAGLAGLAAPVLLRRSSGPHAG